MTYNVTEASGGAYPRDPPGEFDGEFDATPGIAVASPAGSGPFPLFLYLPPTGICHREAASLSMVQAMVQRGFVSASIQYPYNTEYCELDFLEKARTLTNGPISMLCALPQVDCALGIASSGSSQGGHLAALVARYEPRITAAAMYVAFRPGGKCASPPAKMDILDDVNLGEYLPKEKKRTIVIDADPEHGGEAATALSESKLISGYDCGTSFDCLQSDGSGYHILAHADLPPIPDWYPSWHASIWDLTVGKFQPWFWEGVKGNESWSVQNNLDWLAEAAMATPGVTCGEVKASYKASKCCNNPQGAFTLKGRRLEGNYVSESDILLKLRTALQSVKAKEGSAGAARLAKAVSSLTARYLDV